MNKEQEKNIKAMNFIAELYSVILIGQATMDVTNIHVCLDGDNKHNKIIIRDNRLYNSDPITVTISSNDVKEYIN